VGPRAVETLVAESGRSEPVRAAETLQELDQLTDEAMSVGFRLPLPSHYDSLRTAAFLQAMAELMRRGRVAEARGDFSGAVGTYDRIQAFEPDAEALGAAGEAAVGALLRWGQVDLDAGRYLAVLSRVDEVMARLAGDGNQDRPEAGRALELRDEAVSRGTRFVAPTPIARGERDEERAPRDFVDELNDALEEAWTRPPVLVATTDPAEVRRALRRGDWNREGFSVREAARFGRELDVDFVVIGRVARFTAEQTDVRRTLRSARTVQGRDTVYAQVTGRMRIDVEVEMELVETRSRQAVDRFTLRDNGSGRFEWGEYDGDVRDLRLSREERRLFDEERIRDQEWAVEEPVIGRLSERIARGVYEDIRGRLR
jgi:hypothetical protein